MKLYAIVEIDDEMFDDCKEWYISADDLSIRYVEDDVYMHYKNVKDDLLELKPLPEKQLDWNDDDEYVLGYNDCIDEILGDNDE